MPLKRDWKLGDAEGRFASVRVVEEIARRRMSRRHLADLARISLSTLEKVLSGRRSFTLATLVRIEEALGISLRQDAVPAGGNGHANGAGMRVAASAKGHAPDELGNYSRAAVAWLEGAYLTVRPSFGDKSAIYAYRTEIAWDETQSLLMFRESDRLDQAFTQFGPVAVPHQSGHIYLVTNRHGQHRLIVVARPTITGEMHGILTTLMAGRGSQLTPIATPIVLAPIKPGIETRYGRISARDAAFKPYSALLKRTIEEEFALFPER